MEEINYPGYDDNLPVDNQHIDDIDDREEPGEEEEKDPDDTEWEDRVNSQF